MSQTSFQTNQNGKIHKKMKTNSSSLSSSSSSSSLSSTEEEKGKCLLLYSSEYDETKKKEVYHANEQTLGHISSFGCKNICLVGVMGEQRKGKSTLMHVLFHGVEKAHKSPDTFTIGHTVESCTKNIHIWSVPLKKKDPSTGEEMLIFLADSEGIGSIDSSDTRDSQLVASLISLSSVVIFNVLKSTIDETDIQKLGDNARKAQDLLKKRKELSTSSSDSNVDNTSNDEIDTETENNQEQVKNYPLVIKKSWWVQRDWGNLSHKHKTDQEYFEFQLNHQTKNEKAVLCRRYIKNTFPNMKFIGIPDPRKDANQDIKLILKYKPEERNPNWNERMNELTKSVLNEVTPKTISGKPLNAIVFSQFIREIIRGLNEGAIPSEEEQFIQLSDARCMSYSMVAFTLFLSELNEKTKIQKSSSSSSSSSSQPNDLLSLPPHLFEKGIQEIVSKCEKMYKDRASGEVEEKLQHHLLLLQTKMKEEVKKCKKEYSDKVETKIGGKIVEITKIFEDMSERDIALFEEQIEERRKEFQQSQQSSNLSLESFKDQNHNRQDAKEREGSQKINSQKEDTMEDLEPYIKYQDEFGADFIAQKVEEATKEIEEEYIKPYTSATSVHENLKQKWCRQIYEYIEGEIHTNWTEWLKILQRNLEIKLTKEKEFALEIQEKIASCSGMSSEEHQSMVQELEEGRKQIEELGTKIKNVALEHQKKEEELCLELELKVSSMKLELSNAMAEIEDFKAQLLEKEEDTQRIENELKDGFNSLEVRYALQTQELEERNIQLEELEQKCKALKNEMIQATIAKEDMHGLMSQNEQLQGDLAFHRAENESLKKELKEDEEETQQMMQEFQDQIVRVQEESQQRLKKLTDECKLQKAKVLKAQEDLKKINQEKIKLSNIAMEQDKKLSEIRSEREYSDKKLKDSIQQLNQILEKKEEEEKAYREEVASRLRASETNALSQQNIIRSKHKTEVDSLKKNIEDLRKEKNELHTRCQVLNALQEKKQKELDQYEREELHNLRGEREDSRNKYLALQIKYENALKQQTVTQEQVKQLKQELQDVTKERKESEKKNMKMFIQTFSSNGPAHAPTNNM